MKPTTPGSHQKKIDWNWSTLQLPPNKTKFWFIQLIEFFNITENKWKLILFLIFSIIRSKPTTMIFIFFKLVNFYPRISWHQASFPSVSCFMGKKWRILKIQNDVGSSRPKDGKWWKTTLTFACLLFSEGH